MTRFKKILLSVMVVGALGTITTVRVWAALSAESQNPRSSISSATLTANLTLTGGTGTCYTYKNAGTFTMTLSSAATAGNTSITVSSVPAAITLGAQFRITDKSLAAGGHTDDITVNANVGASGSPTVIPLASSLAYSYAAGSLVITNNFNEQGCDAIYSSSIWMYPGQLQKADLTLQNDGSWDAADLQAWMSACVTGATPGLPVTAPHNGGDLCASSSVGTGAGVIFYIQETTSNFTTTDSTHHCWYPSTATTCPLTGSLNDFLNTNSDNIFYLDLGGGPKRANSASNTRYFVVGTELPSNASNTFQGEAASFTLSWFLCTNADPRAQSCG